MRGVRAKQIEKGRRRAKREKEKERPTYRQDKESLEGASRPACAGSVTIVRASKGDDSKNTIWSGSSKPACTAVIYGLRALENYNLGLYTLVEGTLELHSVACIPSKCMLAEYLPSQPSPI